jgi:hypothetical protein
VGPSRRRRWLVLGTAIAAVAALVTVLALGGSDGGGGAADSAGTTGRASNGGGAVAKPLHAAELIRRADGICTDSQGTYLATTQDFPEGETTPDVTYAKILTGISTRAVRRFQALSAPAGLRPDYERYVSAQERVKAYDRQALRAAEAGDAGAYVAAREQRDREQPERYELARAVGLKTCSASRG